MAKKKNTIIVPFDDILSLYTDEEIDELVELLEKSDEEIEEML